MKINFTKKEYRTLLDIIHIADWVMHAHDTEGRTDTQEYETLFQKLFSFAEEMGYDDLIEYAKEDDKYYPNFNFESESLAENYIQEFENNSFWEELTSRLARRDVLKAKNAESAAELSEEEWFQSVIEAEEKWIKEFDEFDLDRIAVKSDG
jgi:hypothetical protein